MQEQKEHGFLGHSLLTETCAAWESQGFMPCLCHAMVNNASVYITFTQHLLCAHPEGEGEHKSQGLGVEWMKIWGE